MRTLAILLATTLAFTAAIAPAEAKRNHRHHRGTRIHIHHRAEKPRREALRNHTLPRLATDGVCGTHIYPDGHRFTSCDGTPPPASPPPRPRAQPFDGPCHVTYIDPFDGSTIGICG